MPNQAVVRFLTTTTRARMSNAWRLSSRIMTIIPIGITTLDTANQWIIQKISVTVSITNSNESNCSNLNLAKARSGSNIPEMSGSNWSPTPIDKMIHKMLIRTKRAHGAMSYNERTAACRRVRRPPVLTSRTLPPNIR